MNRDRDTVETAEDEASGPGAPLWLLGLSWALPGSGHLVLGRKIRALVFFLVVVAGFVTGLLLDGELSVPHAGAPLSWAKAFACLGNGAFYVLGRITELGEGNPAAVGATYGNTFLITAGLMNWLTVLDVSDIAAGRKE